MKKIVVIGAGTMGNGISHVFAMKDYAVTMVDIDESRLHQGLLTIDKNLGRMVKKNIIDDAGVKKVLSNISLETNLSSAIADADLVIEAATENENLKKKIFQEMDQGSPKSAILATNTSSISITRLAAATQRPDRVIGMHFFNPVPVMKLVEVIRGYHTSDEVTEHIISMAADLDKIPVEVKDYPGFISNRILMPMINEAIIALSEGIAGVKEIDQVMTLGMAHPMGPLQLADFIGLDVCVHIMRVLQDGFGNPKYAPAPLLVNMVSAGQLGRKSLGGFYDYSTDIRNPTISRTFGG